MAAVDLSQDQFAALQHISRLVHLFHHRNKNQHRHSVWWRHFSVFRRNLDRLVSDHERLRATPTTHLARTKKKTQNVRTRASIESRVTFWQEVMVARWQRAFSQLVADGRFAVLGLVLVAALAEICKVVGITARLDELGQVEVEKVLERFAAERWEDSRNGGGMEDMGEVVDRPGPNEANGDIDDSMLDRTDASSAKVIAQDKETTASSRIAQADRKTLKRLSGTEKPLKKKKRRKGGDAIDDLFSGL